MNNRVSYVGFFHETNTYLTEGMGETTLDRMRTFRGDQIKKELKGTAIGGAVDVKENITVFSRMEDDYYD